MINIPITVSSGGTTALVAGVPNLFVRIVGLYLTTTAAVASPVTVTLISSGGTALTGAMDLTSGAPVVMPPGPYGPDGILGWGDTLPGEGLSITLGGTSTKVAGTLVYIQRR